MTEQTKVIRRGGLDWNVPNDGKAADAYAVACTAAMLIHKTQDFMDAAPNREACRHATRLHVISGLLHRLNERSCNEGTNEMILRRCASLEDDALEIAEHYGLTCYFQGNPRGCSLYLIDPAIVPIISDERACKAWIDANYTRGHAVVRLGR